MAGRVEVDLGLTGEVLVHELVEQLDVTLFNDIGQQVGLVVVGECLAHVGGHGGQLLLAGGELLTQHDLAGLLGHGGCDLGEHRLASPCPALGEQKLAQLGPLTFVDGLVLGLQRDQALHGHACTLQVGQDGQVRRHLFDLHVHVPGVLDLHHEVEPVVQGRRADGVVAAVVQHPSGRELIHLVLLAVPAFFREGGRDELLMSCAGDDLTGVFVHILTRQRHFPVDGGDDLLRERTSQNLAARWDDVQRTFHRGHIFVGLLLVTQVGFGAELQASWEVLVDVGRADDGVECVGQESVPAVLQPLLAPRAEQHLPLECGVVGHDVHVTGYLLNHLAALVHADVGCVSVVHAHVDSVLQVVPEGERHTCQAMPQRVDLACCAALFDGVHPLVRRFTRRGLNVERDKGCVPQLSLKFPTSLVVVDRGHQCLGAIPMLHGGHARLVAPRLHHADFPLQRVGLGIDVFRVQLGHAPAGGHKVFRVDDLLQLLHVGHVFLQAAELAVLDQLNERVQAVHAEGAHQLHEGGVAEALGTGDAVGCVAHQRLVQRDVFVGEGTVRVLVELALAPHVGVGVYQHAQVAVNGRDEVGHVAQFAHQVRDDVVGLARPDGTGGDADCPHALGHHGPGQA